MDFSARNKENQYKDGEIPWTAALTESDLQRQLVCLEYELAFHINKEFVLKAEVEAAEKRKKALQTLIRAELDLQGKLLEQQLFLMRQKAHVMGTQVPSVVYERANTQSLRATLKPPILKLE